MKVIEKLFSSRVRAKVLASFYLSPGIRLNAHELTLSLNENYNAVWKELSLLESLGILTSERQGRVKIYLVNPKCPIMEELSSIFLKTTGVGYLISNRLRNMGNIKLAFIFGSYAARDGDIDSDLDLMIIGDVNLRDFSDLIAEVEKEIKRPVNYVIRSVSDWEEKKIEKDPFTMNILQAPKIMLIGENHAL